MTIPKISRADYVPAIGQSFNQFTQADARSIAQLFITKLKAKKITENLPSTERGYRIKRVVVIFQPSTGKADIEVFATPGKKFNPNATINATFAYNAKRPNEGFKPVLNPARDAPLANYRMAFLNGDSTAGFKGIYHVIVDY